MRNASFIFTSKKSHGKTPEAAWLLGFRCLYQKKKRDLPRFGGKAATPEARLGG